jgi:hypothetical protein
MHIGLRTCPSLGDVSNQSLHSTPLGELYRFNGYSFGRVDYGFITTINGRF